MQINLAPEDVREVRRLADAAQTALGRVIHPSHTPWDGDSAFVLSSCVRPAADSLLLVALVQEAVCAAVRDEVRVANGLTPPA